MPRIRLVAFPWPGFNKQHNTQYHLTQCGFCTRQVVDRRDVRPDEPPPACPECREKYYGGKLFEDQRLAGRK